MRLENDLQSYASETLISFIAAEIGLFDGYIVVYKFVSDLHFYVTGGEDENELILATVLQGFFDAVSLLLRLHGLSVQHSFFFLSLMSLFNLFGRGFSGFSFAIGIT